MGYVLTAAIVLAVAFAVAGGAERHGWRSLPLRRHGRENRRPVRGAAGLHGLRPPVDPGRAQDQQDRPALTGRRPAARPGPAICRIPVLPIHVGRPSVPPNTSRSAGGRSRRQFLPALRRKPAGFIR